MELFVTSLIFLNFLVISSELKYQIFVEEAFESQKVKLSINLSNL
jgi:hypothetical protein